MIISFRPIETSDAEFVSNLRNSVSEKFLHTSDIYTKDEVEHWIETRKPMWYMILFRGSTIGYFRCSNINEDEKSIYVGADISEEYRGLGLGKKSYKKFIKFISKQGFDVLKLEVLGTNERAINLYTKLGFTVTKVEPNSINKNGKLVDNIFMELKIS